VAGSATKLQEAEQLLVESLTLGNGEAPLNSGSSSPANEGSRIAGQGDPEGSPLQTHVDDVDEEDVHHGDGDREGLRRQLVELEAEEDVFTPGRTEGKTVRAVHDDSLQNFTYGEDSDDIGQVVLFRTVIVSNEVLGAHLEDLKEAMSDCVDAGLLAIRNPPVAIGGSK
jgi:hypothetical protein